MPNRFGGIPVDEPATPTGNRFGGVPVDAAEPEPKGDTGWRYTDPNAISAPMRNRDGVITDKGANVPMGPVATAVTAPLQMMAGGAEQTGRGLSRIRNARSGADFAGGVSDTVRGLGTLGLPFAGPSILAAPGKAALGLVGGGVTGAAAELGLKAVGAPDGYAELGGTVAGGAGGYGATKLPSPANLWKADPRVAVNRALRPTPSDDAFPQRVPQTLSRITKANKGKEPTGITEGQMDVIPAAQKAVSEAQGAYGKWMARAKGVAVSGDDIVKATGDALPPTMLRENPEAAHAIVAEAQRAYGGRRLSVGELDALREAKGKELQAFYDKATGKQIADVIAGKSAAIVKAQRDAIAELLYRTLDPENGGAGPRDIKRAQGDAISILDAARRRNNAIVAEQPLTPIGKVVDPVKAAVRAVMPGKATGAGIAFAEGSEGRSLPLLRRAFKSVRGQEVPAYPEPASPLYPTGDTTKLLPGPNQAGRTGPGGTMYTPPPADTSGGRTITGTYPVPQADPSVLPPGQTGRVIDMATRPAPHGQSAGPEWWAQQPQTRAEIQARYEQLFNRAENLSPQRPVSVPETGVPEGVARGMDSRQNLARQLLGKEWDDLGNSERIAIDQLVTEGYGSVPRYAGGGVIDRPTLLVDAETREPAGIMGEEGPEAIVPLTAGHETVPEKPETLKLQLEQLAAGQRAVVMFPRGTPLLKRPKGAKSYQDEHGNVFIFDPQKTSQQEIDAAIQNNTLPNLLGAAEGGMGAPDKSELPDDAVAVVGRDDKGTTVQATATDKAHVRKTVRQTAKVTPKGGKVAVEPPAKEIERRLEGLDFAMVGPRSPQWYERHRKRQWFHK